MVYNFGAVVCGIRSSSLPGLRAVFGSCLYRYYFGSIYLSLWLCVRVSIGYS